MAISGLVMRFDKFDDYGNLSFACSGKPEDPAYNADAYDALRLAHHKLAKKKLNTFLPIFCNDERMFATIRARKPFDQQRFKPGSFYDVDTSIRQVTRDGKTYLNCVIKSSRLVKRAKPLDYGTEIKLDDSDAEDE